MRLPLCLIVLLCLASTALAQERIVVTDVKVRLAHQDRNVVRSGPGENFSIVEVYGKGAEFPVVAKSGDWYNVTLSDTRTGWVHASLCEEKDDLSALEFKPNPRLYSRVGSFVITGSLGGYSFDRKSNSLSLGGRVGYYLLDFLQIEGGASWTQIHRPQEIVESLFDIRLEEEQFDMLYYHLNATAEILPGRQMVPFVTAGGGASIFQGEAEPGYNVGVGTMIYVGQSRAVRLELRNYRFQSGSGNARRTNNNFEFTFGAVALL
jgi:hypothetical protein